MNITNINLKLTNEISSNTNTEFTDSLNLEKLGLILKQATVKIAKGIKRKNAYEALDEIEMVVFGELLRNRS